MAGAARAFGKPAKARGGVERGGVHPVTLRVQRFARRAAATIYYENLSVKRESAALGKWCGAGDGWGAGIGSRGPRRTQGRSSDPRARRQGATAGRSDTREPS